MSTETNTSKPFSKHSSSIPLLKYAVVGIVVLIALVLFLNASSIFGPAVKTTPSTNDLPVLGTNEVAVPETFDDPSVNLQVLKTTLSKEKFLKKLFEIDRSTYRLYDKAAKYLGVSKEEITQFFFDCCDLVNEADIFSELPSIPVEFSATAYDVSIGKLNQIGLLSENFYKQPEFYTFIDQETGIVNREYSFRPWSKPQLDQWGDNGMQAYPADQFDSVSASGRNTFTSVIFVTNGWNIQNYVGIELAANNEARNLFDITISEERTGKSYFLLGPTFPRFDYDWATKVTVVGKLKPGTPPGDYTIAINPIAPANELAAKWSDEHSGIYASYGFIAPSDGYINLHINVSP